MGKRCQEAVDGKPCPFLAVDGSCLMPVEDLPEKCPARETVKHEEKDAWMNKEEFANECPYCGTKPLKANKDGSFSCPNPNCPVKRKRTSKTNRGIQTMSLENP